MIQKNKKFLILIILFFVLSIIIVTTNLYLDSINNTETITKSKSLKSFSERNIPSESKLSEEQEIEEIFKNILAIRHRVHYSEIDIVIKDRINNQIYGIVGLNCRQKNETEINNQCSHIFYANKIANDWFIIDNTNIKCSELLNIGITENFDTFTNKCR